MRRRQIILIAAACCICGCISKHPDGYGEDPGTLVRLSAVMDDGMESRAPYMPTVPTPSSPLNAYIMASTTDDGSYPDSDIDGTQAGGDVAVHTKATFQSGSSQLITGVYYNAISKPTVCFVAMHPWEGWMMADDDTKASFTFDGSDDVMFAPKTTGSYNSTPAPSLHFSHLLTLLKISISAENETVAQAWGPIKEMTIKSRNGVTVDLASNEISFTDPLTTLPFYYTGTDSEFPDPGNGFSMKTTPEEVAYVLCEPVEAFATDPYGSNRLTEYTISIESEHRNVDLGVDLMDGADTYFEGDTRGKMFTLNLSFMMGNTIAIATRITDWQTGGIGVGNVTE